MFWNLSPVGDTPPCDSALQPPQEHAWDHICWWSPSCGCFCPSPLLLPQCFRAGELGCSSGKGRLGRKKVMNVFKFPGTGSGPTLPGVCFFSVTGFFSLQTMILSVPWHGARSCPRLRCPASPRTRRCQVRGVRGSCACRAVHGAPGSARTGPSRA